MTDTRQSSGTIRVLVPVGREASASTAARARARRGDASSLVIGLLDNHKHNSDKVLDRLEQRLGAQYGNARFVRVRKPEAGKSAPKEVIDALAAECDAVVNGIGD